VSALQLLVGWEMGSAALLQSLHETLKVQLPVCQLHLLNQEVALAVLPQTLHKNLGVGAPVLHLLVNLEEELAAPL
jgi:hypothetical protein